jgi:phosphoserine aminotransferase
MDRFAQPLTAYNFCAGPAPLPEPVLQQVRCELERGRDSLLEQPFSSEAFRAVMTQAEADLRDLLSIPEHYAVLFLQGGASAQFSLVPLNLLGDRQCADYVETGYWSRKAIAEARRYCQVNIAASSAATGFDRVPEQATWRVSPDAAYCHIVDNETADGVAYAWTPRSMHTALVADMTSSLLTRELDIERYGLIYASAQKNIGPAGLTLVIVRRDLLSRALPVTPQVMSYAEQARAGSLLNTPPVFAIYVTHLVLHWIRRSGGIAAMAARAGRQSAMLYALTDSSAGFYRCLAHAAHRSAVNICFRLRDESLTPMFLAEARARGLSNLHGHSRIGGVRASLYNSMPDAGVRALVGFMQDFAARHG